MPFRLVLFWQLRLAPLAALVAVAIYLCGFRVAAAYLALAGLALSGIGGAVLAVFMAFGEVRVRCPFCGTKGPLGGDRDIGTWMHCPTCGIVRCRKWPGLTIIKEDQAE